MIKTAASNSKLILDILAADKPITVTSPRGSELTCKGWIQEAALRMLMNNLDPQVADVRRTWWFMADRQSRTQLAVFQRYCQSLNHLRK